MKGIELHLFIYILISLLLDLDLNSQIIKKESYLEQNIFPIESISDSINNSVDIFAIGEAHNYSKSFMLELKLLNELLKSRDSVLLLLEMSPSTAYLFELFELKNINKIDCLGNSVKLYNKRKFRLYFENLVKIRASLGQGKCIVLAPVDIELSIEKAVFCLWYILNEHEVSSCLMSMKNLIEKNIYKGGVLKSKVLGEDIISHFNKNELEYSNSLANDFSHYRKIILAMEQGLLFNKHEVKNVSLSEIMENTQKRNFLREEQIYGNIRKYYSENTPYTFYGFFGITHVLSSADNISYPNFKSAFERLSDEPQLEVCRIYCSYKTRRLIMSSIIDYDDRKLFKNLSSEKYTLFRMSPNNPFNINAQYILYVKN
jgi:hypothetical protein